MRVTVAVFYVLTLAAGGCECTRRDLVASGAVTVKVEAIEGVRITPCVLDEGGGRTMVSGRMASPRSKGLGSYVEVLVFDRSGTVVDEARAKVVLRERLGDGQVSARIRERRRARSGQWSFRVTLTKPLPQDAEIVIRHHARQQGSG